MVMLLADEGWCTFVLVENEVYRVIVRVLFSSLLLV